MEFTDEELGIIRKALAARASDHEATAWRQQGARNFASANAWFERVAAIQAIIDRIDNSLATTHK